MYLAVVIWFLIIHGKTKQKNQFLVCYFFLIFNLEIEVKYVVKG